MLFLPSNTASKEEKTGFRGNKKYLNNYHVAFEILALLNEILYLKMSFFSLGGNSILN